MTEHIFYSHNYTTLNSFVVRVPVLSKQHTSTYPEICILSILLPIICNLCNLNNAIVAVIEKNIGIAGGNIHVRVPTTLVIINFVLKSK